MSLLRAVLSEEFFEGEDAKYPPAIKFICDSFLFLPEQGCIKWVDLVNAIENGTNYKIDWAPTNGECYIEVIDGLIYFAVSKYGDGKGGYLYVSLDSGRCLNALKDAAEITRLWMERT